MPRSVLTYIVIAVFLFMSPSLAITNEKEVLFTLIHTSDEHSHLLPHSPMLGDEGLGGFARLAGAISQIRHEKSQSNEPVLVVSAGDFLGGTLYSWLTLQGRSPELSLMLEMEYDVITLGNHEFDYGSEQLAAYLQNAGYPKAAEHTAIVASNLIAEPGHPLNTVGISDTSMIALDNGLTIGFFGLLGNHALRVTTRGEGVTFTPQHEAATGAVEQLKADGADVIVAVSHAGIDEDRALAREVQGIDLIVGGHCHTTLKHPLKERQTLIVQSGPLLQNLGVLELAFDLTTRTLRLRNDDVLLALDAQIANDPFIASQVELYTSEVNALLSDLTHGSYDDLTAIVAALDFPLRDAQQAESALGNFVTDALRARVETLTGQPVDIVAQPNGTLRGTILPAQGRVSLYDMIWPLSLGHGLDQRPGYPVVSFYLTGEEVRRILEISLLMSEILGDSGFLQFSGVTARYDPSRAILFWIPMINKPLPSTRAILSAHWEPDGSEIKRGDEQLYHAVSDYYTAAFIPMVGDMLPSLALVPKDAEGNPISDMAERIVQMNGEELKVWQAVLDYTASLPRDPGGYPSIPERYAAPEGRLLAVRTVPLLLWPAALLVLLMAASWILIRRRRRRKRKATAIRS